MPRSPAPPLPSPPLPHSVDLIIGYSTAPGCVSREGEDPRNSVFTAALVQEVRLKAHDTDIAHLLRIVHRRVVEETTTQAPWVSASLSDAPVFLVPGAPAPGLRVRPFPKAVPLVEHIVGREGAVDRILQLGGVPDDGLCPVPPGGHTPCCVVHGVGGVGKSALLREVCRVARRRALFPGGVFWADAVSPAALHRAFRALGSLLGCLAPRDPAMSDPDAVRCAVSQ
jgi:hypothetical protein